MRSGYSDVNWLFRAARVIPVIAGAALLGGMIGGFAMFAIDSALTWEPAAQRADADDRANGQHDRQPNTQAKAADQHVTKPVRIVGGAIPDPSAGMSGPPPAPQEQRDAAPAQPQISSQLLTPKPLGPASALRPQTATGASPPAQPQNQAPVQTQNPPAAQQQPTRSPDARPPVHQNAANNGSPRTETTGNAQKQSASPPPAAQSSDSAANKNSETDRHEANGTRAATADDQDRGNTRHERHSRRHSATGGPRNGGDNNVSAAASPRRQDARAYDRYYDSYGNRGAQWYREQPYGDARDQNDDAYRSNATRLDMQGYGRDAGYRNRSREITREQPELIERRPEPFWGGGFFRGGGYQFGDD